MEHDHVRICLSAQHRMERMPSLITTPGIMVYGGESANKPLDACPLDMGFVFVDNKILETHGGTL